ncbi:trehalase family glycosidase [Enterococcus casseliflavus]|uniref:MGH1-like glycoside hydrolase domain-containing protein n=1 Tax=Enterococcus casseliflavus TaxID=37734 RepID=UPI0039A7673D
MKDLEEKKQRWFYMRDIVEMYVEKFNKNDEELFLQDVPNNEVLLWMKDNVPEFHCSDKLIEEAYYFRWWVFRKHIKTTQEGRIITEFLPEVSWSGPFNSINCAAGHHIAEARWLKQGRSLIREYINFWFRGSGDIYSYSTWILDSINDYAIQWQDHDFIQSLLKEFVKFYEHIESTNMTKYGLFWSDDDRDAMEMSISGKGLRPTLNSYMYGNCLVIGSLAKKAGEHLLAEKYFRKAEALKEKIVSLLWDEDAHFFKVIPQSHKDEEIHSFDFKDINKDRNVREQIGYIPWHFGLTDERHQKAWQFLNDPNGFKGDYGPTTAERSHHLFNKKSTHHECLWNGPSWPFATTQTLNSMIYEMENNSVSIQPKDFLRELRNYANSFYRVTGEGEKINWLDENIEPNTGEWLSRRILEAWGWPKNKGGRERGKDYNHSTFNDLVIRGMCGIKIVKENTIHICPHVDNTVESFTIKDLIIFNKKLTIEYKKCNEKNQKNNMFVIYDGENYEGYKSLILKK